MSTNIKYKYLPLVSAELCIMFTHFEYNNVQYTGNNAIWFIYLFCNHLYMSINHIHLYS